MEAASRGGDYRPDATDVGQYAKKRNVSDWFPVQEPSDYEGDDSIPDGTVPGRSRKTWRTVFRLRCDGTEGRRT